MKRLEWTHAIIDAPWPAYKGFGPVSFIARGNFLIHFRDIVGAPQWRLYRREDLCEMGIFSRWDEAEMCAIRHGA